MMKNVNNVGKTSFKSIRKITFYAKRDFCLLSKVKLSIAKTPY